MVSGFGPLCVIPLHMCAKDCWTKPTPPQQSGRIQFTAQKPMRTSWKSGPLSQKFIARSRISDPCPGISRYPKLEIPLSGRTSSMFCRSEITDGGVRPDCRHRLSHYEDRAPNNRL